MSPFIHKELFKCSKYNGTYSVSEIEPDDLGAKISTLRNYSGFNITIPHKQSIIPYLDKLHPSAKLFGAVNTVLAENGKLTGFNTDADGFYNALKLKGVELCGKVLICGCGGVARAIAVKSAEAGADITLGVRDVKSQKAINLKKEIKEKFNINLNILNLKEVNLSYDIIVNGTPLGMYPNINASPLLKEQLKGAKFVFDTVYNPEETLILKYAKELGIKGGGGMDMLVLQAAKAHEYWYGAEFSADDIEKIIKKSAEEMRNIFENK